MIVRFKNQGTEDLFNGVPSRAAGKTLPPDLTSDAVEVVDYHWAVRTGLGRRSRNANNWRIRS